MHIWPFMQKFQEMVHVYLGGYSGAVQAVWQTVIKTLNCMVGMVPPGGSTVLF
jgi:hypothetical protein